MSDPTLRRRAILLQLLVSSVNKLRSYSLENPADLQQVVAGEYRELGLTTASREAGAKGVAVAEEVVAQAKGMEGDVEEEMEEGVVKEARRWSMASIYPMSPDPYRIRNRPLSPARIGAMSMKSVNASVTWRDLLGNFMQPRLLLLSQTDLLSLLTSLSLTTTIEELAEPVPIVAGDVKEDEDVLEDD